MKEPWNLPDLPQWEVNFRDTWAGALSPLGEFKLSHGTVDKMIAGLRTDIAHEMRQQITQRVGMLRQWLNEDRITDKKMVTNEELLTWLLTPRI